MKDVTIKITFTARQWERINAKAMPSGEKSKTKRLMYVLKEYFYLKEKK